MSLKQQTRSKGSCDTEEWSNDAEISALQSQEFYDIYKNRKHLF